MFRKLFYIVLFFSVSNLIIYGQVAGATSNQLKLYKEAKKKYHKGDYAICQTTLRPLLETPPTNLTPYGWFYYALAGYQQGQLDVAEMNFAKIIQFYPDWAQQDEVLYWLAQLRFEQNDYLTAFAYLKKIQDASFTKHIKRLKKYFLSHTTDTDLVSTLRDHYPTDRIIAETWLQQQLHLPLIKQDTKRIHEVGQSLGIAERLVDPLQDLQSLKKDTYHVAVLLPFFIGEVDYKTKSNAFVLDIYRGLQAAVDKLYQQGIHIVLHPYDTKKSVPVTEALLSHQEMEAMDLIIGPLYANTIPCVSAFSKKNQINCFNPLSVNADVVGHNPFMYLIKPSLETQAKQAAYFTQQSADLAQACMGVVYGSSPEDSLKAHLYKSTIEQTTGKDIDLMLELNDIDSRQFLSKFRSSARQPNEAQENQNKEVLDNLTHIYIASHDELVTANVLSALQIRKLTPFILADDTCIKKDLLNIRQLQTLPLFFIAPDYINYDQEGIHNFRTDFYNQFGLYPSYHAAMGYDMMLFLGEMLLQHGVYFQKHWPATLWTGQIFNGFAYGQHYDNQHVPIIQFKNSKFIVCNAPNP